jgi:hypothetical protein
MNEWPFELLLVPAFLRAYLFDKNAFNSIFISLIFRYEGILVLGRHDSCCGNISLTDAIYTIYFDSSVLCVISNNN